MDSVPTPASISPARGSHTAAPDPGTMAGLVVVMVRSAVPEAPLDAKLTGDPVIEQAGALVVGVTLQVNGTFPTSPVEVTVMVAVPVLPREIVLGVMAPIEIVNCDARF